MSEIQKIGYGFIDDTDASLKTKSGGKFGLNAGTAFMTKFEYNPNSGKDKSLADALDITIQVQEKEFNVKIYPVTKVYDKDSQEITDVTSKEYITGFNAKVSQDNAVILHLLKATGVTEAQIRAAFGTPVTSFVEFINSLVALLPVNFTSKPLDIFLEYQWTISESQDRTFLQLPKNMKGGYFACPAQQGTWIEQRVADKLTYINEVGTIHPFERDKNFMEGNKAKQQGGQAANDALASAANVAPAGNGGAKPATW